MAQAWSGVGCRTESSDSALLERAEALHLGLRKAPTLQIELATRHFRPSVDALFRWGTSCGRVAVRTAIPCRVGTGRLCVGRGSSADHGAGISAQTGPASCLLGLDAAASTGSFDWSSVHSEDNSEFDWDFTEEALVELLAEIFDYFQYFSDFVF